ncbi:MAG: hypothetical protein ABIO43_08085 [Sphingomicrobium sp.]
MLKFLVAVGVLIGVAGPAYAMNVHVFLTKAEALKKKGPLALFSSDLKLLMQQVESDMTALKVEKEAAEAANRPTAFCPPKGTKISVNDRDILDAMRAVPPTRRTSTDSTGAIRAHFARRYPCPS